MVCFFFSFFFFKERKERKQTELLGVQSNCWNEKNWAPSRRWSPEQNVQIAPTIAILFALFSSLSPSPSASRIASTQNSVGSSVRLSVRPPARPPAHPSFETYADASWYKQGEEQAIEKREYNRRIPSHTPPNIKALKNGHPELLKLNSKFFAHSLLCCVSRRFSCLRTEITVEDLNPEKKGRNTTLLVCCSFCVVDCRLFIESAAVALDSTCTSKHSLSFSSSCLSLPSSPPTPPPH